MIRLIQIGIMAVLLTVGSGVSGVAQGGGSRVLQPPNPCVLAPESAECAAQEEADAGEVLEVEPAEPEQTDVEPVEVEPLPAPEPTPRPVLVEEDTQASAPELTSEEEALVEESTITPLYDEDEVTVQKVTENNVVPGIGKIVVGIYLLLVGIGFLISLGITFVTYTLRRKNGGNSDLSYTKTPIVMGCLVALGVIAYGWLSSF